jgi:hypothetical protein
MKHTIVLLLIVALLAAMTTPAVASPNAPRLKVSHFECIDTTSAELHFVLIEAPPGASTATVEWIGRLNGWIVSGVAPFERMTGSTAHYAAILALEPGSNTFAVDIATVTIEGVTYHLENAQTFTVECAPLGLVIATFTAACTSGGVRLEWETTTELGVTSFTLSLHDAVIATIPAQHPGAPIGASYVYTDTASAGGVYTLAGAGEPATATAFCGPTAVTLTTFTAKAPSCYVTGRWPTYACMCGRVAVPMLFCKAARP